MHKRYSHSYLVRANKECFCLSHLPGYQRSFWPCLVATIFHRFSTFNLTSFLLPIVKSYLSDCHIFFLYKNSTYSYPLRKGCLQDSVLGPTLWNILFNDLFYLSLPSGRVLYSFADDTLLITSYNPYDNHITSTNCLLHLISHWMKFFHLSLNFNKTIAINLFYFY